MPTSLTWIVYVIGALLGLGAIVFGLFVWWLNHLPD